MVKSPPANAGDKRDAGSIAWSKRSPGGGNGNPLQYSCLGNPTDRGAWRATVLRSQSWTRLKQLTCNPATLKYRFPIHTGKSIPCKPCIGFIFTKGQIFHLVVRKLSSKANRNMSVFQTISFFFFSFDHALLFLGS